tara:strand:- start:397 stop:684 length:288 start_codon:yes stop_codon:yes gene_type:complete
MSSVTNNELDVSNSDEKLYNNMDIDLIKNFNYQKTITSEGHSSSMFNLMNHYKTVNLFENFILTIKKPNKNVLEIGTGYGCCLAELADKYTNNNY